MAVFTQTATKPEGPLGDFKGDIKVDNTPPSKSVLAKSAQLSVLDADNQKRSFGDLTKGDGGSAQRVLVVFVRHFFCGNCQEYIRTLARELPPSTLSALSTPTTIIVIGCGLPSLIPMYIRETSCPYPVYVDPTRKLYDILGMTKTLALGDKSPEYMRQPLYKVAFQSFIQELKSGRNMLSGGDYWQVGGEFIFERDGSVAWCHRMKNTRDHAEMAELRRTLNMEASNPGVAPGKPIGSRRSMSMALRSGPGLVRKMSDKRKSWRASMIRSRNRNTEANGSLHSHVGAMEKLKEESGPDGGREDALAKLIGSTNGATKDAVPAAAAAAAPPTTEADNLVSAPAEPGMNHSLSNGVAAEDSMPNGVKTSEIPVDESVRAKTNGHVVSPIENHTNAMNGEMKNPATEADNSTNRDHHTNGAKTSDIPVDESVHAKTNGHVVSPIENHTNAMNGEIRNPATGADNDINPDSHTNGHVTAD